MAKKRAAAAPNAKPTSGSSSGSDSPSASKTNPSSPRAEAKGESKPVKKSGSNALVFLVLPVVVALIGGLYTTFLVPPSSSDAGLQVVQTTTIPANMTLDTSSDGLAAVEQKSPVVDQAEVARMEKEIDDMYPPLFNKYESELMHITTQKLLTPAPTDRACPAFEFVDDLTPVREPMSLTAEQLRSEGVVFLMLNGQNEGLYVKWNAADECLQELALLAGERLGADVDVLQNGVRLMTQMGLPITSAAQLDQDAGRIAHVLLDFQIWVWPGIEVGHVFDVDGVTVKTLSMRPRVFGVEGFFTAEEADEITRQGINRLERSPVDSPEAVDGYHSDRTSFTAFLKDNQFTRDFRARTAKLARLPSPSFAERLQLVRYETGQFFRKHEDYFDSKKFVPTDAFAGEDYKSWCTWASAKIQELQESGVEIPEQFQSGNTMHPKHDDILAFQHALLGAFMEDADASDFFTEHADVAWGTWIRDNVNNRASDIVGPLLRDKGYMLPHIIKSWEKRLGIPALTSVAPKRPVSGVTHYFRWLRWTKERIQDLMDENPEFVSEQFRPNGIYYPTYNIKFQNILVEFILEDNSEEELQNQFGDEWTKWLIDSRKSSDVLWEGLKVTANLFELVVKSFTKRAGDKFNYEIPTHLQHFEPNRFVTVFLYLNECPEGGETVFPYSKERLVTGIEREGMQECSEGLAVPPTRLTAAMFYAQTPENFPDPSSLHGGCPPARGTKYGANSFAWNADADEGANAWDLGSDLKRNPSAD